MKYPIITGIVLWLTWGFSIILGPGNFDLANNIVGTDYIQFYTAGMIVRSGNADQLYDISYQKQIEETVVGAPLNAVHAFINPPFHTWVFIPLSLLSYPVSFVLWSILGLLGLWLSLGWLGLEKRGRKFVWSLTWFPVFASITFGQNSLISLTLLSLGYYLWLSERRFYSGLVCSLLLYKPQLLIGVGLLWLLEWRRDWKSLAGVILGAGILTGLSIWFYPQATQEYFVLVKTFLPKMQAIPGFPIWHSHTIRSFWIMIFKDQSITAEIIWLSISVVGIIVYIIFWKRFRATRSLLYAGAICLTILITPHAIIYDWVLLLIPAVILWEHKPEMRKQWKAVFALIWIATFVSGSLSVLQYQWFTRAFQISIPIYLYLLFFSYKQLMDNPEKPQAAVSSP